MKRTGHSVVRWAKARYGKSSRMADPFEALMEEARIALEPTEPINHPFEAAMHRARQAMWQEQQNMIEWKILTKIYSDRGWDVAGPRLEYYLGLKGFSLDLMMARFNLGLYVKRAFRPVRPLENRALNSYVAAHSFTNRATQATIWEMRHIFNVGEISFIVERLTGTVHLYAETALPVPPVNTFIPIQEALGWFKSGPQP